MPNSNLRRKCVFNADLQKKYPFIRKAGSDSDVVCQKCNSSFNIGAAGKSEIERHLNSVKHKKALNAASNSQSMTNFFGSATDFTMAACEGVWAYHVVKSNHSFKSSDCASKIFRTCFAMQKFHCAHTKCEAIVTNVFAPFARDELKKDLLDRQFLTVSTDASNRASVKIMPVLVRYFVPTIGVRVKMLNLSSQKGETSLIISDLIKSTAERLDICDKIVGFCADNCVTNFGSVERGGNNNVFYRLKKWRPFLIGVGCAAHIVHNALKTACDELPFDIECLVVKIFSHFYIHTVRSEALKVICDTDGVEYSKLLGYVKTRFLALGPAIGSILKIFDALKTYFSGLPRCPKIIRTFFNNPLSKLWLLFVKDQADYFHETVLKIEGENVSAVDVAHYLEELRANILLRKEEKYFSPCTEDEINNLRQNDEFDASTLNDIFVDFYVCADEYLCQWSEQFEQIRSFAWIVLRGCPEWPEVKATMQEMSKSSTFDSRQNSDKVCQQYGYVKTYCSDQKISEWRDKQATIEQRWVELFQHMQSQQVPFIEFSRVVEFILCLPGTSAPVERVFSSIKNIWKTESSQLKMEILQSMLFVKNNIDYSCIDFFHFLKSQPQILRQISGQGKYNFRESGVVAETSAMSMAETSAMSTGIELDSDDD